MKKIVMLIGIISLLTTNLYADYISLDINDMPVNTPVAPVLEAGTTLVPLRIIGENLGASLGWDDFTKTVTINKGAKEIKLVIGSKTVKVNHARQQILAAPRLIKGTTMVPIRFISENLDSEVYWDSRSRTVFVSNQGPINIPAEPLLMQAIDEDYIILSDGVVLGGGSKAMDVDINGDGIKEIFIIERDHPNGLKILGILGSHGQNFSYDFRGYDEFDAYDHIKRNFYTQITCYDLDGDGVKEIIVSRGDKLVEMETLIYHPTSENVQDPFRLVGRILGQANMYIDENHSIIKPYGGQGLFVEYIYKNGQLYELEKTNEIR